MIITLYNFSYMFLMLCMNVNSIPIKCTVLFFIMSSTQEMFNRI